MIKKLRKYVSSDICLLAVVLLIYGCSSYNEKKSVDWNGLNYAKCSDESKNPECKAKDDSDIGAIGKGGKR